MAAIHRHFISAASFYLLSCLAIEYSIVVSAQKPILPLRTESSVGAPVSDFNREAKIVKDVSTEIGEALPEQAGKDPRSGSCTDPELHAVEDYFSTNHSMCPAYDCVSRLTQEFFENLNVHYPGLWLEGGDSSRLSSTASLLAACACRCEMMKCEVNFVAARASRKCYQATIDYCNTQNALFKSKCKKAADAYDWAVKKVAPDAVWTSICHSSCQSDDLGDHSPVFGSDSTKLDSDSTKINLVSDMPNRQIDGSFVDFDVTGVADTDVSEYKDRTPVPNVSDSNLSAVSSTLNEIEFHDTGISNITSPQYRNRPSELPFAISIWCIFVAMFLY